MAGCDPNCATPAPIAPIIAPSGAISTPAPEPLFAPPVHPALSPLGETLVIEFEVGGRSGYNPHPELPDLRLSGVTVGIGYDLHQNTRKAIITDWHPLPAPAPARLAATQPFYGNSAVDPLKTVKDIIVPWATALGVFDKIDVAREWSRARRALPGFDALRPNAQAALLSLGFNRGWSMVGDNRREVRAIRDAVPHRDYTVIATQLRIMVRVWRGTSIEHGMYRRRMAEADLVETP